MLSGINNTIYQSYEFEDLDWVKNPIKDKTIMLFLSHLAIKVGTKFYVKSTLSNSFMEIAVERDAKNKLFNELGKKITINNKYYTITRKLIDIFFSSYITIFDGTTFLPMAPDFVLMNGNLKYVNLFRNTILKPDTNKKHIAEPILRMIRESLAGCNDVISYEEMISELKNRTGSKEYRFIMNWIGAIYQRPGINLSTNLWIIGKSTGVGKGMLLGILRRIFVDLVGKFDKAENFDRGWTESLTNKLIIEADEFKSTDKYLSDWIKDVTTNEYLQVMVKGSKSYKTLNLANWIFTSNDTNPLFVEENERRNQFIQTTNNQDRGRYLATTVYNLMGTAIEYDMLSGFAAILSELDIDWDLIKKSYDTELTKSIKEVHMSEVELWLSTAFPEKYYNKYVPLQSLLLEYNDWRIDNGFNNNSNSKSLGNELTNLQDRYPLDKKRNSDGMTYRYNNELPEEPKKESPMSKFKNHLKKLQD